MRSRRRYASRDPRDDLGAILEYARRVQEGDEGAREVLHDALLERYPKIYGRYVRLAETPSGYARVFSKRAESVGGTYYAGRRLILLYPDRLAEAEQRLRQPRRGGTQSAPKLLDWGVSRAFQVVGDWTRSRPGDLITYRSRYAGGDRPEPPKSWVEQAKRVGARDTRIRNRRRSRR